jgi:Leucine-rich repeat (LRR) protein
MKKLSTLSPALICLFSTASLATAAVDFKSKINPILQSNCVECHSTEGGKKAKGGLDLSSPSGILAGNIIVAGKPDESTLYMNTVLDPNDEDIMPPKKTGSPLSKGDTDLIKQWITEGASFGTGGPTSKPGAPVKALTADQVRAMGTKSPDPDAIRRLTELGAVILPASVDTPQLLSVEFISTYNKITDEQVKQLYAIAPNIVELNLAKTKITDESLKVVGSLANLNRLNLNNTRITDAGLANLAGLNNLDWINLYGTDLTDNAVPHLAKLRKLKSIFLWGSKISDEGVAKLTGVLSSAKVVDKVVTEKGRFDIE